jgi:guanylate kinase
MPTSLNQEIHSIERETLPINTFIIVRGMPGSGKSTLLEAAYEHFSFELIDPDITYGCPDEFEAYARRRAESDEVFEKLDIDNQMYRFHTHKCVEALKSGKAVIWAQAWSRIEGVQLTIDNMRELVSSDLIPVVVELTISDDEAEQRVVNRFAASQHRLSPEEFAQKFRSKFEIVDPTIIDKSYVHMNLNGNSAEYNLEAFLGLLSTLHLLTPESVGSDS